MSDTPRSKTVLGPDCKISGDLVLDNDAVIMGRFNGTLRVTGTLEVTESASIEGTILVGALRLSGESVADVVAEQTVELTPGATFRGRVFTGQLVVAEGADFEGAIHIGPRALDAAAEVLDQAGISNDAQAPASPSVQTNPATADAVLQRRRPRGLGNGHRPVTNGAGNGHE